MSNWKERVIANDNPAFSVGMLPRQFVENVTVSQINANKGWAPDMDSMIDHRVVNCPDCGAPGMNTCWGFWVFTCGAEIMADGEVDEPCGALVENKSAPARLNTSQPTDDETGA